MHEQKSTPARLPRELLARSSGINRRIMRWTTCIHFAIETIPSQSYIHTSPLQDPKPSLRTLLLPCLLLLSAPSHLQHPRQNVQLLTCLRVLG